MLCENTVIIIIIIIIVHQVMFLDKCVTHKLCVVFLNLRIFMYYLNKYLLNNVVVSNCDIQEVLISGRMA
jgi:hypothetical protein